MNWTARSHPNIAFVKYMGKADSSKNVPINSSLSYCLDRFYTEVSLEVSQKNQVVSSVRLKKKKKKRFIKHWEFLKKTFKIKENVLIKTSQNFPLSVGLSSSSSSFAALTSCAHKMFIGLGGKGNFNLPLISQRASGSSARSFFDWALWDGQRCAPIKGPKLFHFCCLSEDKRKEVSSSEAHERVKTSLLFSGRAFRAKKRVDFLKRGLAPQLTDKFWAEAKDVIWNDFWDMHALFYTSLPPFSYINPESIKVLEAVSQFWKKNKTGPWVTMDAGACVHLFFKDKKTMTKLKNSLVRKNIEIL